VNFLQSFVCYGKENRERLFIINSVVEGQFSKSVLSQEQQLVAGRRLLRRPTPIQSVSSAFRHIHPQLRTPGFSDSDAVENNYHHPNSKRFPLLIDCRMSISYAYFCNSFSLCFLLPVIRAFPRLHDWTITLCSFSSTCSFSDERRKMRAVAPTHHQLS